eukprot:755563-Hanusia_phi.AAC.1
MELREMEKSGTPERREENEPTSCRRRRAKEGWRGRESREPGAGSREQGAGSRAKSRGGVTRSIGDLN